MHHFEKDRYLFPVKKNKFEVIQKCSMSQIEKKREIPSRRCPFCRRTGYKIYLVLLKKSLINYYALVKKKHREGPGGLDQKLLLSAISGRVSFLKKIG